MADVSGPRRFLPLLAWAGMIPLLTSVPVPPAAAPAGTDKPVHLAMSGVLGFPWVRAYSRTTPSVPLASRRRIGLAAFGGADEWRQRYIPGRSAERSDRVAGVTGGAVGILLAAVVRQHGELSR